MNRRVGPKTSTNDLVRLFEEAALGQWLASIDNNTAKHKRLYHRIEAIVAELKSRTPDQRIALAPLLDHENWEVKVATAVYLVPVDRDRAIRALKAIEDAHVGGASNRAYTALLCLSTGEWKPT